jgi:hypothetical protein
VKTSWEETMMQPFGEQVVTLAAQEEDDEDEDEDANEMTVLSRLHGGL